MADTVPVIAAEAELTILDHLREPVILLGARREVIFANEAAVELLEASFFGRDLALSFRHPSVLEIADAVLAGAEERSAEIDIALPVPRILLAHAIGVSAPRPGQVRAVLTFNDVTDARASAQIREDFVANVSHELRSPVAALVGFIETLRSSARDDAEARERFLGIMAEEASRMARLIDDLLSLSRVEATEHVRPRQPVDVAMVLGGVRELLAGRAAERQMEIRVELADGLTPVPGSRDELAEVFHNLLDNAVKYGRAGTAIRVTAHAVARIPSLGQPGLAVAVENEGDGIEAEHIPRLTERFYRVDKGRSRKLGGTGLGLAIVKHIVNRHRGRLVIESELGKGARFTVFLPAPR